MEIWAMQGIDTKLSFPTTLQIQQSSMLYKHYVNPNGVSSEWRKSDPYI